ncbi:hypothetical protein [Helicobacter sp. 11S02629-2]|uniref:hypothetical protein n=1 Tax=Helicobacter sp. 11S02629-2 TaxID=1476195 RepID=UPI000BA6D351|nr:hypothetical protein [Helicobacter sp. 11S02629-2]PAF43680.1 hypothetical protein BKH40_06675 [Helicobacter sp. 11S02629-2]
MFLEKEGKAGALVILVLLFIFLFLSLYTISIIIFICLLIWLKLFSTRVILPSQPENIIAPINGVIKDIKTDSNFHTIYIKTKNSSRIYAPFDLSEAKVSEIHGFSLFYGDENIKPILNENTTLKANYFANSCVKSMEISIYPTFFKSANLTISRSNPNFLDKIGFLNFGLLVIRLDSKESLAVAIGDSLKGGVSPLLKQDHKKDSNEDQSTLHTA